MKMRAVDIAGRSSGVGSHSDDAVAVAFHGGEPTAPCDTARRVDHPNKGLLALSSSELIGINDVAGLIHFQPMGRNGRSPRKRPFQISKAIPADEAAQRPLDIANDP
jgi:hypothetical protein